VRGPLALSLRWWWGALKRTAIAFRDHNLTDWAAALTYYAVLSIFPAMIVLVSILGLLGQHPQTTNALLEIIDQVGPESTVDTLRGPIEDVIRSKSSAGLLLAVGTLGALWAASGYIGAFTRASNIVYDMKEGRPFWKLRPLQLLITLVSVLAVAVLTIAIVLTGDLAEAIAEKIGLENLVSIFEVAKWPALFVIVMTLFSALYYVAPNVRQPGFRWITPGSVIAVLLWVAVSAGFSLYVSNLGSYNKTYGSLGAVVVFLIWLWLTNMAVLFGAEFNSELERSREMAEGTPEEQTLTLEPRERAEA
jgi:membrane protein